jgi:pimeloyl-ACP methyl ester carboxylesterase
VEELTLIGHSMGGLVIRSAAHYGAAEGNSWPDRLGALIFLGTPHSGAPLEQRGNLINVLMDASPYVAPFARLGKRRSAGITDLRYSNLVDEDWLGRDRFAHGPCDTCIVPLPAGGRAYAVAATLGSHADSLRHRLLGDGLVPLDSALGRHADPARALPFDESNSWIAYGMSHLDLLGRGEVYERIAGWLREM